LRRDIEGLGTRLKAINIGLVPLAVLLAALVYDLRRRRRQDSRVERREPGVAPKEGATP
jgi:hypothetical protein